MRNPRELSSTGIYHVMVRGNEKKNIFHDDRDRLKFLDILSKKSKDNALIIYAYCLMDNHVHLVIKEDKQDISTIMRSINTSYAQYFNKKYNRSGHVFQDRFKSEAIENDSYLLEAIRYIHNNPTKANIVKNKKDYKWSSYNFYLNGRNLCDFLEVNFILNIFSCDKKKAKGLFEKHSKNDGIYDFIDIEDKREIPNNEVLTVEDIEKRVLKFLKAHDISYNQLMQNREKVKLRNQLILQLKKHSNFSNRDLADILEVNRNVVQRVK